jgi:hypothetical protein
LDGSGRRRNQSHTPEALMLCAVSTTIAQKKFKSSSPICQCPSRSTATASTQKSSASQDSASPKALQKQGHLSASELETQEHPELLLLLFSSLFIIFRRQVPMQPLPLRACRRLLILKACTSSLSMTGLTTDFTLFTLVFR